MGIGFVARLLQDVGKMALGIICSLLLIQALSAPVRATNYTDRSVQSGHIYFYAVTAVDSKGKESIHSSQAKASIPSP
jgi:hypothetical protein